MLQTAPQNTGFFRGGNFGQSTHLECISNGGIGNLNGADMIKLPLPDVQLLGAAFSGREIQVHIDVGCGKGCNLASSRASLRWCRRSVREAAPKAHLDLRTWPHGLCRYRGMCPDAVEQI